MKTNMKRFLGILLSLVMVLGLMVGMSVTAYAAELSESFTTNEKKPTYTGEHFTISCTDEGDGYGFYLSSDESATISARNGEIITKAEFTKGNYDIVDFQSGTGTVSISGDVATVSGVNATSLNVTATGKLQIKAVKIYYQIVSVTGVSLDPKTITLTVDGDAIALTATVEPNNVKDKTGQVSWTGDAVGIYADADCTKALKNGGTYEAGTFYVKGLAVGSSKITVTTTDGGKTATCDVTVNPATYAVTYKVVNGTWSDGSTKDQTEDVANGSKPSKVPTGMKAAEGYAGGAWDKNPAETTITEATTFTYTFTKKEPATVTKAPAANTLTCTGSAQELVTAGTAEGGTMQYALGTDATTAPTSGWGTSVPTGTDAKTYYVWYMVKGDETHVDSAPACVTVTIAEAPQPEPQPEPTEPISIAKAKIQVADQPYTGKKIKPQLTVKVNGVTLVQGTDYTVKFKNNKKIGKATVTVTGIGNYKDKAKKTFMIVPKNVRKFTVEVGKDSLFVQWKKAKDASGYEIECSPNKKFRKTNRWAGIVSPDQAGFEIRGLNRGKTYYVRIRTYQDIGKKRYYSLWSEIIQIKTK